MDTSVTNGKSSKRRVENFRFINQNLTEFPLIKDVGECFTLNLTKNPVVNFKSLKEYDSLVSLILNDTKLSSFKFAPNLPQLEEICFCNTPLYKNELCKIMTLIAFGEKKLKCINFQEVTERERKEASRLSIKVRDLVVEGWVLTSVDPIRLFNPMNRKRKVVYLEQKIDGDYPSRIYKSEEISELPRRKQKRNRIGVHRKSLIAQAGSTSYQSDSVQDSDNNLLFEHKDQDLILEEEDPAIESNYAYEYTTYGGDPPNSISDKRNYYNDNTKDYSNYSSNVHGYDKYNAKAHDRDYVYGYDAKLPGHNGYGSNIRDYDDYNTEKNDSDDYEGGNNRKLDDVIGSNIDHNLCDGQEESAVENSGIECDYDH